MNINITKRAIKFDYLNKNNRVYKLENIQKCIPEFLKKVNNHSIYGCFVDDIVDEYVNLSKVSHRINNVYINNNNLYVDIDVLNTHNGKILQDMIENNVYFNLSPLSVSIIQDNYVFMYKLLSFNIVTINNDPFLSESDIRKNKLKKINKNK